ncbi:MAG: hypothetical protein LBT85_00875 [Bifidobacteriaceae bacterium]|nr:hypothetical protein [Bifidobacteriaceae bacterium]
MSKVVRKSFLNTNRFYGKFTGLICCFFLLLTFFITLDIDSPNAEASSTTGAGSVISPAVDCDPYTPGSNTATYNVNIRGTVNTTSKPSDLQVYLYAATIYDLKFVTGDNFTPNPSYKSATFQSLSVPANFACLASVGLNSNYAYDFSNLKVRYSMPAEPDIGAPYKAGANQVISKKPVFFVRAHDKTGQYIDSWGQDKLIIGNLLGNAKLAALQQQAVWKFYSEINNSRPGFFKAPRDLTDGINSDFYNTEGADQAWAFLQAYCTESVPDAPYYYSQQTCDLPPFHYDVSSNSKRTYYYGSMSGTTFRHVLKQYFDFLKTFNDADTKIWNYGIVPDLNHSVNYNLPIDMTQPTGAYKPQDLGVPKDLKVGDQFTINDKEASCFNSKKQPLEKKTGTNATYIVNAADYNTQIYCSKFKTFNIDNYSTLYGKPVTKIIDDAIKTLYQTGCTTYTRAWGSDNYYKKVSCLPPDGVLSAYNNDNKIMNDNKNYIYESQTNWSNAVASDSVTIPDTGAFTFDKDPETGVTSNVVLSQCTTPFGKCSDDPAFHYSYQWQRWQNGAWKTVSVSENNGSQYMPVSADWGNELDTQHYGKMQVVVKVTYTGSVSHAYNEATHSEIINLKEGITPDFNFVLNCVQTNDNAKYYSDGTCASGDSLHIAADLPIGFSQTEFDWQIYGSANGGEETQNISNTSDTLVITGDIVNQNSKCKEAFSSGNGQCKIIGLPKVKTLGYAWKQGTGNSQIPFKQGVVPLNYTPALVFSSGSDHPAVDDTVNLTGLYNPNNGWNSYCKISEVDKDGTESLVQDWTDCTPGIHDFNYLVLSDQIDKRLKIGVKTVNAASPDAFLSGNVAYDNITAKFITSQTVTKGSALPSGILKFDPNYSQAKVGAMLEVIGVPEGWSLQAGSCKILSDGKDITQLDAAKCSDTQISYIPRAEDLGKKIVFSGVWQKAGFFDSPLSIESKTAVQAGDNVDVPAKITGLLQNSMTVYLQGVDMADWTLTECKLKKIINFQETVLQDCLNSSKRNYQIAQTDIGAVLRLSTHYTRPGYKDSIGDFTSGVVQPGDYPYSTELNIVSDISGGQTEVRVGRQVIVLGLPDQTTGWNSDIHWQLCSNNCTNSQGQWQDTAETSEIYEPQVQDLGKYLRVVSHVTKEGFIPQDLYSEAELILESADPIFSPVITGNLNVGQILTVVNIPSSNDPEWTNIEYKWFTKLESEPDSSKVQLDNKSRQLSIAPNLANKKIQVQVKAINSQTGEKIVNSSWTDLINPGLPINFQPNIIGNTNVGEELIVTGMPAPETGWSDVEYQWYRVDKDNLDSMVEILGAKQPNYRISSEDFGYRLLVKVKLINSSGAYWPSENKAFAGQDDLNPSGKVVDKGSAIVFKPVLQGNLTMGSLLNIVDLPDSSVFDMNFIWLRCSQNCQIESNWSVIPGENSQIYRTVKDDVDKYVKAKVVATHKIDFQAYNESIGLSDALQIAKGKAPSFSPVLKSDFKVGDIVSVIGLPDSNWKTTSCIWHFFQSDGKSSKTVEGEITSTGCKPYILTGDDLGLEIQLEAAIEHNGDVQFYETGKGLSQISAAISQGVLPDYSPVLSGVAEVDKKLTIVGLPYNLSNVQFSYKWQKKTAPNSPGIDLDVPENNYIDLTADLLDFYISVDITVNILGYEPYSVSVISFSKIGKGDAIVFIPRIIGVAKVGEILQVGDLPDSSLGWKTSFSWLRDDGKVVGTDKIYKVGPEDLDKSLSVIVRAVKSGYNDAVCKSILTQKVLPGESIIFEPQISGMDSQNKIIVGGILQAKNLPDESTSWKVDYAWYIKNGDVYTKIDNSDNSDYMPSANDVGKQIYLGALAKRIGFEDFSAYSNVGVEVVNSVFPTYKLSFNQKPQVESELEVGVNPQLPTDLLLSATYKWYLASSLESEGQLIPNAENKQYMVPYSDAEKYIYATLTLSKPGFETITISTNREYISNPIDPSFAPQFTSSTAVLGQTIALDENTLLPDPFIFSSARLYIQKGSMPDFDKDELIETTANKTFSLGNPEFVGHKIYALVTMADPGTNSVRAITNSVGPITLGEIDNFTPVINDGTAEVDTPRVDDVLSAGALPSKDPSEPTWVPDFSYKYNWKVGGVSKSQSANYKVQGADIGKQISLEVEVSRDGYNNKIGISVLTKSVDKGKAEVFAPKLVGTFMVDEGIITVEGLLDGYAKSFSLEVCSDPSDSASCQTASTQPEFLNNNFVAYPEISQLNIRLKVVLSKEYYEDSIAWTPISEKIAKSDLLKKYKPIISGNMRAGNTVGVYNIIDELDPDTQQKVIYNYSYQWQIGDDNLKFTNIEGAIANTYRLKVSDFGDKDVPSKYVRVQVTVSREGFDQVIKSSDPEKVEKGDIPEDLNTILYCGNNLQGQANLVYQVGVVLSVCGLPENYDDSQFLASYKWFTALNSSGLDKVQVSSDSQWTPESQDLGKYIFTEITLRAKGYLDEVVFINSGDKKIDLGEALDLTNLTLSNNFPKVNDTIRIVATPQDKWKYSYKISLISGLDEEKYLSCGAQGEPVCKDSFIVKPQAYNKVIKLEFSAFRDGFHQAVKTLQTQAVALGDAVQFKPFIKPLINPELINKKFSSNANLANIDIASLIKVGVPLEIQGVPESGNPSLPFDNFQVEYEFLDANGQNLSKKSVFTPSGDLADQNISCKVKILSVGFADSQSSCDSVKVNFGDSVDLDSAYISGDFSSGHFISLEGLPEISQGWNLSLIIWAACDNLSDDFTKCKPLSTVSKEDLDSDYTKDPPSYELTDSRIGKYIKVYVEFSKTGFEDSKRVVSSSEPVKIGQVPYFEPEIEGENRVGAVLTAWGAPAESSGWLAQYQWLENDKIIKDANKNSFILTASQLGKNISVKISISNPNPAYKDMTAEKTSKSKNILLGKSLKFGQENFRPEIIHNTYFFLPYYALQGDADALTGWWQNISWLHNGQIVPGQNKDYWITQASRNTVSAILKLSRPGYQPSEVFLR